MKEILVISRDKWARGGKGRRMYNSDGTLCILGIYGRSKGLPVRLMRNSGCPASCLSMAKGNDKDRVRQAFAKLFDPEDQDEDAYIVQELYLANDDPAFTEDVREQEIVEIFKSIGVKATFVDNK